MADSDDSSDCTSVDTVALGTCRISAARVKLPVSTTWTNTSMACSLFMMAIVQNSE
jgi:hypothetical protein